MLFIDLTQQETDEKDEEYSETHLTYFQLAFHRYLHEALQPRNIHLWTETELRIFHYLKDNIYSNSVKLFIKLILRVDPSQWTSVAKIKSKYQFPVPLDELCKENLLVKSSAADSVEIIQEASLQALTLNDIKQLYLSIKGLKQISDKNLKTKSDFIQSIFLPSKSLQTRIGTPSSPLSFFIRLLERKNKWPFYRIESFVVHLVEAMEHLILIQGDGRPLNNFIHKLHVLKVKYPKYEICLEKDFRLFPNRDFFEDFIFARNLYLKNMTERQEEPPSGFIHLWSRSIEKWIEKKEGCFINCNSMFHPIYYYTKILWHIAEEESIVEVLLKLLYTKNPVIILPSYHGKWWKKYFLSVAKNDEQFQKSDIIRHALADDAVVGGYRTYFERKLQPEELTEEEVKVIKGKFYKISA